MNKTTYNTIFLVIAVIVTSLATIFNDKVIGFWSTLSLFITGVACGYLGFLIGDAVRKFTIPDSFFTSGGMFSILKEKLFWMVGPQLIGTFVGSLLGMSILATIVLELFGVKIM